MLKQILYFLLACICLSNTSCNYSKHKSSLINKVTNPVSYSSGDIVTNGYLDESGNMWFTTTLEGVFKYNGSSFKRYTTKDGLCGNQVWAILEANDGTIWLGTESGLCKFNGKTFESISIPKDTLTSDWLKQSYPIVNPNAVTSLIQDKTGDFWVGSNGAGAYHYDGNQFKNYLKKRGKLMPDSLHHNVILSIVEDDIGDLWFSSFSHGGISQFNGNKFIHHVLKDDYGDGMTSNLYLDKNGILWVGTRNGGIYKYNGSTFENIADAKTNKQIPMANFLADSKGNFWVSSYARNGIYQYKNKLFIPFKIEHSDQLIDIKTISEDSDGNIWFGGRYGLLWQYNGKVLKDFTQLKRVQ